MSCTLESVTYPEPYLDKLRAEVEDVKVAIAQGKQPIFDNVDELFDMLESM